MKIKNQFNKSIKQTSEISNQEIINKNNLENISIANSINQYIKKLEDLNGEWQVLDHLTGEIFFPAGSERVTNEVLAYEWRIDLNFLPEVLIPYLNTQIVYKSPENLPQRALDDDLISFKTTYNIQLEEVDGQTPKIALIANIFVSQRIDPSDIKPFEIEDIEAKLLLTLQNPNNYV